MNLFTYGTLMDPAVWLRVAGEKCVRQRAVLGGYEARRLRGVTFPGLVEEPGVFTGGWLYRDVSAEAMARLDAYEDDFYVQVALPVELEDGTILEAQVYLMMPEHRSMVLPARWVSPE